MKIRMSKNIIRSVLAVGIFLSLPNRVFAIPADYQQCLVNQTCTIGEFLFDDTYTPIATAACSITSRYPDGDVFINNPDRGIILKSPNGKFWRITIDNNGDFKKDPISNPKDKEIIQI
jgi:hypothetical protein